MRWLLFVPLLVLLALFALSNPQDVEIRLWPFDLAWVSPLGVAVLLLAALAFLVGALMAWASSLPARRRASRLESAVKRLEADLAAYRAKEEQARRDADLGRATDARAIEATPAIGGR